MRRHFSTDNLVGMAQASLNRLSRLLYRPAGAAEDDPAHADPQQQQLPQQGQDGSSASDAAGGSPEFLAQCRQLADAVAHRRLSSAEERTAVEKCFQAFCNEVAVTAGAMTPPAASLSGGSASAVSAIVGSGGGVLHTPTNNTNSGSGAVEPTTDELAAGRDAASTADIGKQQQQQHVDPGSIRALSPSEMVPDAATTQRGSAASASPSSRRPGSTPPTAVAAAAAARSGLTRMSRTTELAWIGFFQLCYAVFQSAPEAAEEASLSTGLFTTLLDVVDCTAAAAAAPGAGVTGGPCISPAVQQAAYIIVHDLLALRPSILLSEAAALRAALIQRAAALAAHPVSAFVECPDGGGSSNGSSSAPTPSHQQQQQQQQQYGSRGHSRAASSSLGVAGPSSQSPTPPTLQHSGSLRFQQLQPSSRHGLALQLTLPLIRVLLLVQRAVLRGEASCPELVNEAKSLLFGGGGVDALLRAFELCQAVVDQLQHNHPVLMTRAAAAAAPSGSSASSSATVSFSSHRSNSGSQQHQHQQSASSHDRPSADAADVYVHFVALVAHCAAVVGALVRSNVPHKELLIVGAPFLARGKPGKTAASRSDVASAAGATKKSVLADLSDGDNTHSASAAAAASSEDRALPYSAVRTQLVCSLFAAAASCIDSAALLSRLFPQEVASSSSTSAGAAGAGGGSGAAVPNSSANGASPFLLVAVGGQLSALPSPGTGVGVSAAVAAAAASPTTPATGFRPRFGVSGFSGGASTSSASAAAAAAAASAAAAAGVYPLSTHHHAALLHADPVAGLVGELAETAIELCTTGEFSHSRVALLRHEARHGAGTAFAAEAGHAFAPHLSSEYAAAAWAPLPVKWDVELGSSVLFSWRFASAVASCFLTHESAAVLLRIVADIDSGRGPLAENILRCICASLLCLCRANPDNATALLRAGAFETLFHILVPGIVLLGRSRGLRRLVQQQQQQQQQPQPDRRGGGGAAAVQWVTAARSETVWSVAASLLHSLVSHNMPLDGLRIIMASIASLKRPETTLVLSGGRWAAPDGGSGKAGALAATKQRELCEFVELCLSTLLSLTPVVTLGRAASSIATAGGSAGSTPAPSPAAGSASQSGSNGGSIVGSSTSVPYMWFEGRRAFASCIISSMPGGWNGYSVSLWVQPSLVWADGTLLYSITESSGQQQQQAGGPQSMLAVLLVANGNTLQLVVRAATSREQVTMTTIPDSSFLHGGAAGTATWHHVAVNHSMSGLVAFVDGRKCGNISAIPYLSKKSKAGKFYLSFGGISASAGAAGLPTSFGMLASGQFFDGYLSDKEVERIAAAGPFFLQEKAPAAADSSATSPTQHLLHSAAGELGSTPVGSGAQQAATFAARLALSPGESAAADRQLQQQRRATSVDQLLYSANAPQSFSNATEAARLCAMPCLPDTSDDGNAPVLDAVAAAAASSDDGDGDDGEAAVPRRASTAIPTISDRFTAYPKWSGPKVDHGEVSAVSAHIGASVAQTLDSAGVLSFCTAALTGIGRLASRSSIVILCADFLAAYFQHCPLHGRDRWAAADGPARLGAELLLWNTVPSHVTFALFSLILTSVPPPAASASSNSAVESGSGGGGGGEKKYFARHATSAQVLHLVLDIIFGPSAPRATSAILRELANFLNVEANARYFCEAVGMETFLAYTTVCDNSCIDDFVTVVERIVKQPREMGELLRFLSWRPLAEPHVLARLDRMRCAFLCMLYDIVKANEVRVPREQPSTVASALLGAVAGVAGGGGGNTDAGGGAAGIAGGGSGGGGAGETLTYPIAELIHAANGVTELVTAVKISEHEMLRICAVRLLCMTTYCSAKARLQYEQLGGATLVEEALLFHVAQFTGSPLAPSAGSDSGAAPAASSSSSSASGCPTIMTENVFQCLVKASLDFYRPNNEAMMSGGVLSKLRAASAAGNAATAAAGSAAYAPDGSAQVLSFSGHVPSMLELRLAGGPSPAPPVTKHASSIVSTGASSDGLESKLRSDDGYNVSRDRLESPAYVHTILRVLHSITEQLRPLLTAPRCSTSQTQQQTSGAATKQTSPTDSDSSSPPPPPPPPHQQQQPLSPVAAMTSQQAAAGVQALAALVVQVLKYVDRLLSLQPNVVKLLAHSGYLALEELFNLARPFCAVVWAQHMDGTPLPFITTTTTATVAAAAPPRRDSGGLDTPKSLTLSAAAAAASSSSAASLHARSMSGGGSARLTAATTTTMTAAGPLIFFTVTPAATTIAALVRNITRSVVLVDAIKNARTTVKSCVVGEFVGSMPVLQRVALEEAFRDMSVKHRIENLDAHDASVALRNLELLLAAVEEHGYVAPLPLSLGMELVRCVDSMAAESTPAIRTRLVKTRIIELRNRLALHLLAEPDFVANEAYADRMISVAQSCRSDASATPLVLLKHVGDCVRGQNAEALMSALGLLRAVFAAEEEQRAAIVRIVGSQEVCDALVKTHRVVPATATAAASAGAAALVPMHFASWVKEHPAEWDALQKRLAKLQKPVEAELKARAERREKESQARLKQQVADREKRAAAASKSAAAAASLLTASERRATQAMEETFARVQFERVQRFELYAHFEKTN